MAKKKDMKQVAEPEPFPPFANQNSSEIPAFYQETYLHALPKDPRNIFVFWETAPATTAEEGISGKSEAKHGQIRISKVIDGEITPVETMPIENGEHSRHLTVPECGVNYRIEYGHADDMGEFVSEGLNADVTMPAARLNPRLADETFVADSPRLMAASSLPGTVVPESAAKEMLATGGEKRAAGLGSSRFAPCGQGS